MASKPRYKLKTFIVVVDDITGEVGMAVDVSGFTDAKASRMLDATWTRIDCRNWSAYFVRRKNKPKSGNHIKTGRKIIM